MVSSLLAGAGAGRPMGGTALAALPMAVSLCRGSSFQHSTWPSGVVLNVSGATGLGVFLALLGLWMLRQTRGPTAMWLAVWGFSPFVLTFLVSFVRPYYVDRYMIIAAPGFALLAAVALVKASGWQRPVLVTAVVVMTAVGLGEWYSLGEGGNWRGEDWRGAVALTRDRGAGEIIVAPGWASRPAEYYGAEVVETSTGDSVWVITWSEDDHDLQVAERQPLGIRDHVLREMHSIGWRVSAQLWSGRARDDSRRRERTASRSPIVWGLLHCPLRRDRGGRPAFRRGYGSFHSRSTHP